MRSLRHAAVCCVLVAAAAQAAPRRMKAAAKKHLEAGMAMFERGRYPEAIAEFDAGYAIDPHPDFLYARAQAQRLAGDCQAAVESYQRFLETAPPANEERLARQNMARCPRPAPASAPASAPAPAPAPTPPPVATPPPRPFYADPLGDALVGSGVVAAAVGVVFLLSADRHVDAANQAEVLSAWHRHDDAAGRARWIGGVSLAVGGAAVAAGITRWLLLPNGPEVAVSASGAGPTLVVGGRF